MIATPARPAARRESRRPAARELLLVLGPHRIFFLAQPFDPTPASCRPLPPLSALRPSPPRSSASPFALEIEGSVQTCRIRTIRIESCRSTVVAAASRIKVSGRHARVARLDDVVLQRRGGGAPRRPAGRLPGRHAAASTRFVLSPFFPPFPSAVSQMLDRHHHPE